MTNYLITGTRSGIGLECVRQLSQATTGIIIACVRSLEGDLAALRAIVDDTKTTADIRIVAGDLADPTSIAEFPSKLPEGFRIDVLIQCAAILLSEDRTKTALDVTSDLLMQSFSANVVGPVLVLQALVPLLNPDARVLNITSGLASMTLISNGTFQTMSPAYCISKTALNMYTVHAAKQLAGKAMVALVDPGYVKTKMGGPGAFMEAGDSAGVILKVARELTWENTGAFYAHDGSQNPW